VVVRQIRLRGTHVLQGAEHLARFGLQRVSGQPSRHGFGDSEADNLGNGLAGAFGHQHVPRLQIAMQDPLAVGVVPASQTSINGSRRAVRFSRCRSQDALIATSSTYSIAKNGRPPGDVASRMRAMCG
jgi:hypothetical protein